MKAIVVFTAYFTHKARTCIYISSWTGRHRQLSDIELHTTYIYIYISTNFFLRSEELEERDARGERGVYTRTRSYDIGKEFGDRLGRYFVRRRVLRRSDFSAAFARFVSTSGLEGDAGGARCAPSLCIAYNAHAKTKGVTASPLRREEYAPIAVAANAVPIAANICTLSPTRLSRQPC